MGAVRPIEKHWDTLLRCTQNGLTDAVWGLTHVGPKKTCIRLGQGRTNPFADARSEKMAMRPFVKILCPLVSLITFVGGGDAFIFVCLCLLAEQFKKRFEE